MDKNPVGRPRGFDESQVLDAAMQVFWRKGYELTSLKDLMEATGLHKGSLYQAFGDKHALFMAALRAYVSNLRSEMSSVMLGANTASEGLRKAMYKVVDMCVSDDANPGCMALNSLVEQGPHDEEVLKVLEGAYAMRSEMITQGVRACQEEGSLRKDWSPERIAAMIESVQAGLAVSLKGPVDSGHAHAVVDDLLTLLAAKKAA